MPTGLFHVSLAIPFDKERIKLTKATNSSLIEFFHCLLNLIKSDLNNKKEGKFFSENDVGLRRKDVGSRSVRNMCVPTLTFCPLTDWC